MKNLEMSGVDRACPRQSRSPGQPHPLNQAGSIPWEFRPTFQLSLACSAQARPAHFLLPLVENSLPETGSEKDQWERTTMQGSHKTPPDSVSSHTPNQRTSINMLALNRSSGMMRVATK